MADPQNNAIGFEPFVRTFQAFMDMQRDGASLEVYLKPLVKTLDGLRQEREALGKVKEIEKLHAAADERDRQAKAGLDSARARTRAMIEEAEAKAAAIVDRANNEMAKAAEDLEKRRAALAAASDSVRVAKEERAEFENGRRALEAEKRRVAQEAEAAAKMKSDYEARLAAFSKLAGAEAVA
ncbi:MAG: hypothetical protein VW338_00030 [Rhodospirillaceae bacterium]